MATSIRDTIGDILYYIGYWFFWLYDKFYDAADWVYNIPYVGPYIAAALYAVGNYCYYIYGYFLDLESAWYDLCDWLDNLWDNIVYLWDYLIDLWDYIIDWVSVEINSLWNYIVDLYDYVVDLYYDLVDLWDYVTGWVTDTINDAWDYIVWTYNQIVPIVTAKAQEIYDWVKGIPAEIKDYIAGVVTAIGAVTTDIVQTLINTALAAIAAPINLINLWFDDIQNFFNDPWGWLTDKFEDWFFGPEK